MKPDWRDGKNLPVPPLDEFTLAVVQRNAVNGPAVDAVHRGWRLYFCALQKNNPASYRVLHIPSRGVTKSGVLQFCCIIKMGIAQNKFQQASQGLVFLPRGTHGQESSCGQKFFLLYV